MTRRGRTVCVEAARTCISPAWNVITSKQDGVQVPTLSAEGYREHDLEPGGRVRFSPGVIHRLINLDGRLEIFVVMQNWGRPEAGDFVKTMPLETLRDPEAYFAAASLSAHGEVFANSPAAAARRRDLAVEGFTTLRHRFEVHEPAALPEFYAAALRLVQPQIRAWQEVWRGGPRASGQAAGEQLAALPTGHAAGE